MDKNPRFPHHLKILRPILDANGDFLTDEQGNPREEVVFESVFGYRTQTSNTRTKGEVIESDYKIALPWTDFHIRTRDLLEITDYTHTYRGEVIKAITYNPMFGTTLWYNERKI